MFSPPGSGVDRSCYAFLRGTDMVLRAPNGTNLSAIGLVGVHLAAGLALLSCLACTQAVDERLE